MARANRITLAVVGAMMFVAVLAVVPHRSKRTKVVMVSADGHSLSHFFSGRSVVSNQPKVKLALEERQWGGIAGRFLDKVFGLTTVHAGLASGSCSDGIFSEAETNCADVGCSGDVYYAPGSNPGIGGSATGGCSKACGVQSYCTLTD